MLVSVLMPVYNNTAFLREALESVLQQTHDDLEVIVIDDGSEEDVESIVTSYDDPRIVFRKNPTNIGFTRSLNVALDLAHGDFIARHDSDDINDVTRIEKELRLFDDPKVGYVSCWARTIDKNGKKTSGYCNDAGRGRTKDMMTKYQKRNCFIDACSVYTRAAVDKVGYFDERMVRGQARNYNLRVLQFFSGRILEEVLYLRRRHETNAAAITSRKYPNTNWSKLSAQRARDVPIIRTRNYGAKA